MDVISASFKYRNEEELLAQVDDPVKYNDEVIWPDKVRLNLYYLRHYSFLMDLSYLMQHKPIIAATDPNCDTGSLAEANGYGFWCPSNSVEAFTASVDKMLAADIHQMGDKGYLFFLDNYTVQNTYDMIMKHFG